MPMKPFRRSKNALCVYVDLRDGEWFFSENGCKVTRSNGYRTICSCDHLSVFAVLTHDLKDEEVLFKEQTEKFQYDLEFFKVLLNDIFLLENL